jgi:hypothetical protein
VLTAGNTGICALGDRKLVCWGQSWPPYDLPTEVLKVSVTEDHTCALTAQGGRCWGIYKHDEDEAKKFAALEIQKIEYPERDYIFLDVLPDVLMRYARASGTAKATYFHRLKNFFEKNLAKEMLLSEAGSDAMTASRLLMLRLIAPAVLQTESVVFQKNFIPLFQESQPHIEAAACKVAQTKNIKCIQDSILNRSLALAALQSVVEIGSSFLVDDSFLGLLRTIGTAVADPGDDHKIDDVIVAGNSWVNRHADFKSSARTSFVSSISEVALRQLKEKGE